MEPRVDERALDHLLSVAVPFAIQLRTEFRGVHQRLGCVIPGPSGWGEFAPFDDYSPAAAARWLGAALEAAFGTWPVPERSRIETNAIIPAIDPHTAVRYVTDAVVMHGCTTVKVKLDGELALDEPRIAAIRSALDSLIPDGRIRVDVNGRWSQQQALHDGLRLASYGLEYIEQPTRELSGLGALRDQVPIAVDEGVRLTDRTDLADVADIAVIKVAPLGGVGASLQRAERIGLPIIVSGSMDSSIGLAAGIAAAAAIPDLAGPCGFGTGLLIRDDLVDQPTIPIDGSVHAERRAPDLDALARARARVRDEHVILDRLRQAWWAGASERWAPTIMTSGKIDG